MKILYDGYIYSIQTAGGINRYFANIISRLPEGVNPAITTRGSMGVNAPKHSKLKTFYYPIGFRPKRFSYPIEKYYFRAVSALNQFNLVHPTYYSSLMRQEISEYQSPLVLTVHDMIHEKFFPDHSQVEEKRTAIAAAQAIICVSENTKKDLLERFSIPEDKIHVTHLASELDASLSYGDDQVPQSPYYLYVGSRSSYKNFDRLIEAFSKVASVRSDVKLCVVGSRFDASERKLIADLNLVDRIEHYGHTSDQQLAKLYRCSIAFVYPSLYEGFGIPPLEAMACGTVVVAANTSSIPEVVGEAGILFDPHAVGDLADILLRLHDQPSERGQFISQGYERAKTFSWDKTAAQTLDVYRSIAS